MKEKMKSKSNQGRWVLGFSHLNKMLKKKKKQGKKNKKMVIKHNSKKIESFQDNQICRSPILKKHGKRKAIEVSCSYPEGQQGNNKKMMISPPDSSNHSVIVKNSNSNISREDNNKKMKKKMIMTTSKKHTKKIDNQISKTHRKRKAVEVGSSYQEQHGNKKKIKYFQDNRIHSSSSISPPILKQHGKRKAIEVSSSVHQQQGNKRTMISSSESSIQVVKNISPFSCKSPPKEENKTKLTSIHDLPEDVLTVILIRLPLKYLLRCRSVHKSWYSLVRSPNFINLHLNHQKMMNKLFTTHSHHHPKYLFFEHEFSDRLTIRFDDKQCEKYYTLESPPDLPRSVWLAQSYGLICMTAMFDYQLNYKPDTYLWNPLIQKYKTLPHSPISSFTFQGKTRWTALSFGFVPQVNDYVVVHIVKPPLLSAPDPHSVMVGVYSLNSNSWKITSQDNVLVSGVSTNHHIFIDGVAYWLGTEPQRSHQIIVCFDTNSSILREISLPNWVESQVYPSSSLIHPFGQSIAYFVQNLELNHLDMWVLRGNPINEFSWEKKMSVSPSEDFWAEVLGLRNNGEPILFKLFELVSYSLDSHEANDFVDSWDRWGNFSFNGEDLAPPFSVSPFVESLVLLN